MSQTNDQKATQIISALGLPEGHYAVLHHEGSMVIEAPLSHTNLATGESTPYVDRWMDIYVTTAVWFQLYESTESGILWTLCLPDPNNPERRCDHPHLEYDLTGITIRVFYAIDRAPPMMMSEAIASAEKLDGIPVLRHSEE